MDKIQQVLDSLLSIPFRLPYRILTAIAAFMSVVFLWIGLWPFHFNPRNSIAFDMENKAWWFSRESMIKCTVPFVFDSAGSDFRLNMEVKPGEKSIGGIGHLVSWYDQKGKELFFLGQWKYRLLVRFDKSITHGQQKEWSFPVTMPKDEFVPVFMEINGHRMNLCCADSCLEANPQPLRKIHGNLQAIAGCSPNGKSSWKGWMRNLHFNTGNSSSLSKVVDTGTENAAGLDPGVVIPERFYSILSEKYRMPWQDFEATFTYLEDVVLNFFGFVVYAALFYAVLVRRGVGNRRAIIICVLVSFFVSFTIETTQIFLPSRTSQFSDLVLNTLGGLAGAWGYKNVIRVMKPGLKS